MTPTELLREAELRVAQAIAVRADGSEVFTPEERKELIAAWTVLFRIAGEAEAGS